MARIRTIKPEFPQSESMGRISRDARLLFVLLWTIADDDGRARANSRMLASLLFPYDDDAPKHCGKWLDELRKEGCVVTYEVDGQSYLAIANWRAHQKIDRASASRLPEPPTMDREDDTSIREASPPDLGPRTMDLGPDISRAARADTQTGLRSDGSNPRAVGTNPRADGQAETLEFEAWYAIYPRHRGKAAARRAYAAAKRRGATAEHLRVGVERYAAERKGEDPKFTAHPATWLNQGRWEDRPDPAHVAAGATTSEPTMEDRERWARREAEWVERLREFEITGQWQPTWGPEPIPGAHGVLVPLTLRERYRAIIAARHLAAQATADIPPPTVDLAAECPDFLRRNPPGP